MPARKGAVAFASLWVVLCVLWRTAETRFARVRFALLVDQFATVAPLEPTRIPTRQLFEQRLGSTRAQAAQEVSLVIGVAENRQSTAQGRMGRTLKTTRRTLNAAKVKGSTRTPSAVASPTCTPSSCSAPGSVPLWHTGNMHRHQRPCMHSTPGHPIEGVRRDGGYRLQM